MVQYKTELVVLPDIPAKAGRKARLSYEVAERIVDLMNMCGDPSRFWTASLYIRHHGGKEKDAMVYLTRGSISDNEYEFKKGSEILEAVEREISLVSCVESVTVTACPVYFGTFVPED